MRSLPLDVRFLFQMLSFLIFCLLFIFSWTILGKKSNKFRSWARREKSEACINISDSFYSVFILLGVIHSLSTIEWDHSTLEPLKVFSATTTGGGRTNVKRRDDSTNLTVSGLGELEMFFGFAAGYYLQDMLVSLFYKPPSYFLRILFRGIILTPFMVFLYAQQCQIGSFVLALFLNLEWATLTANATYLLKHLNKGDTQLYSLVVVANLIVWIISRLVCPIAAIVLIHAKVLPAAQHQDGNWECLIPSIICAYLILLFLCLPGIFVVFKEFKIHWKRLRSGVFRNKKMLGGGRSSEDGTHGEEEQDNEKRPLRKDELDLCIPSSNRILLYDTRERWTRGGSARYRGSGGGISISRREDDDDGRSTTRASNASEFSPLLGSSKAP